MELFVARQPIFDRRLRVFAYELLFRSGLSNAFDGTEENVATSKVITAIFYSAEGEHILGGKPAFINFPHGLLTNHGASFLPPEKAVIEVLETVQPDAKVIASCGKLRALNYRIALDDFVDTEKPHPLVPYADFIKVDLRATSARQQTALLARYGGRAAFLAEKVETQDEFQRAAAMGYKYFQGYFFARPAVIPVREIPGFKLNYLRILKEIHAPELNIDSLTVLLTREPSLSFKLLRFVNSALFAQYNSIESIGRAIVYIGEEGIRRWLSIVTLTDLTSDKPVELVVHALIRARFGELLAPEAGLAAHSGQLFLVGLTSLLDAMLGRPLEQLLGSLNLHPDVRRMLLNEASADDLPSAAWQLVLAYEAADWPKLAQLVKLLGIRPEVVPGLYASAVKWADEVFQA